LLTLEVTKSRTVLNVQSRWSLAESIERTMQWYLAQGNGADARMLCESDITAYEGLT
jgi:CDP-glucose 4,6-dehydratase